VNLHRWIARALWSGAASLGIALVAGLLSLVLKSAGDDSGAAAVRGVMLVSVSVCGLTALALVALLAVNELQKPSDK
jgi:Na+/melibiose symporter-like transporter